MQYEVIFQEGQECGGAYLKLLSESKENENLRDFRDSSPYTIMFGPDKCGNDHKVLDFQYLCKGFIVGALRTKWFLGSETLAVMHYLDRS